MADCPYFARVELLADQLAANLPHFEVMKIVKMPSEWKVGPCTQLNKRAIGGWMTGILQRCSRENGGGLRGGFCIEFVRIFLHY